MTHRRIAGGEQTHVPEPATCLAFASMTHRRFAGGEVPIDFGDRADRLASMTHRRFAGGESPPSVFRRIKWLP